MGDFGIAAPATYKVAQLRALVKAHMATHPELMLDDDYAPLFTKRVRDTYLAQNPPGNRSSRSTTPASWHGIGSGSQNDSDSSSSSSSDASSTQGSPTPVPRDLAKEARRQLLESISEEELERMIQGHSRTRSPEPIDAVNSALVAQKRPERQCGLTASNAAHLIPDAIRKRFAQGWKQHVPLHFLTDKYCSRDNVETTKELDDTYSLDGSRGIIAVSKPLPAEPELALNFAEWFQGWARLLELIATYVPNELADWRAHYERILKKSNKDDVWDLWVAYDSEIRHRCCTSGIDPSILHLEIWNDLEVKHMTRVTYEKVSADLAKANKSHHFRAQGRRAPS
ncbi:hypothetical protein C8R47DRAFT_1084167 [Mycena vitilis]|nr:hypothetical protein C8R47DRAFT_1084167 [Mycena vitilis]